MVEDEEPEFSAAVTSRPLRVSPRRRRQRLDTFDGNGGSYLRLARPVLLCSRKRGVTVRTLRDRYERLRVQFRPEHSLAIRTWPPPALPSGASVVRTPRVARTEALSFLRRREGSGACRGRSAGAEKSWRRLLRGGRQGAVTPRPAPPALPPLAGLFIVLLGWRRIARRSPFEGASFVSPFDSPRRFPAGFFLSASKPRWPLPRSSDLHVQSLPRRETGGVFLSVWKTRACI